MNKNNLLKFSFYFCIIFGIILLSAVFLFNQSENISLNKSQVYEFNDDWTLFVNGINQGEINLNDKINAHKNDVVVIQKVLPEIPNNYSLYFDEYHKYVKIFVEDNLIYSYGYNANRIFGKSPGSGWHLTELPSNSLGKTIRVELISPYEKYSSHLRPILIGTHSNIIFKLFNRYYLEFFMSVFMLILGLVLIFSNFFIFSREMKKSLIYLGIFTILLAIWSSIDSKCMQMFFGDVFSMFIVETLCFTFMPIPFLLFVNTINEYQYNKRFKIFYYGFICNFILVNLLQIFNIADYIETLIITHVLMVVALLYAFIRVTKHLIKRKRQKEPHVSDISIIILIFFAVSHIVTVYITLVEESVCFFKAGMILFILILVKWIAEKSNSYYYQKIEDNMLKILVYTDTLTQIGSRFAFEREMDTYRGNSLSDQDVLVFMFDLNYLKTINDLYGHAYGDQIIINVANCLKESFEDFGKCFRIGGDEFCVSCNNITDKKANELLNNFNKRIAKLNESQVIKITVAYGFARYNSNLSDDINKVLTKADKAMYNNKAEIKQIVQNI